MRPQLKGRRKTNNLNKEIRKTRSNTRPIIADGWAGAEMRVFTLSNLIIMDGPMDQRTDGWTDGQTDGQSLLKSYLSATKKEKEV